MCSSSSVASAPSSALDTQISISVAKKALDTQKEEGAQAVALISSAKAISDLNARAAASAGNSLLDVYA